VLYGVNPATKRISATIGLPSQLVINPNDVASGSGTVWAAVGATVYRVGRAGNRAPWTARSFASVPRRGLIGDIAVDAGSVWVTDTTTGTVYRFDASTGRLQAAVRVGATASIMTVGDGGIWVADDNAHTLSRISVQLSRVNKVLTVPGVPGHIAATAGSLWVTMGATNAVTVLDVASGRASTADGTLTRIDARRQVAVATVPVGVRPYGVAVDRQGVWVTLLGKPTTMHGSAQLSSPSTTAGLLALLKRLCGGG
jgi:streptogramin lyase